MNDSQNNTFEDTLLFFKKELMQVEEAIEKNFITDVSLIPTISRYLSNNGGKRIRPLMLIAASKMCGYNNGNRHVTYSCIVEFIHLATLLHDDVLDEAVIRRGKDSANLKWGNKASVLVADYLFANSYVLMADDNNKKILHIMTRTTKKMVEGETLQLMNIGNLNTTEDSYMDAINRKTAVLFSSSCRIGSILGGVSKEKENALFNFGKKVGYAFQLVDDVLDYFSTETDIGKRPGIDLSEGKITLPLIHLYKNASRNEKKTIEEIVNSKENSKKNMDVITGLMRKYKSREYTIEKANRCIQEAKAGIRCFEGSPYFQAINSIADYVISRNR